MQETKTLKFLKGIWEEEEYFPFRRCIREGEFLDMMDITLFTRIEKDQVDETMQNSRTRNWSKMSWRFTSNPRLMLAAVKPISDCIERAEKLDAMAWSQTCLYAQGRTQFCKTHFNPNQEWQASTSVWCPLRRLCRMEANPHANQLWGRMVQDLPTVQSDFVRAVENAAE